MRGSKAYQLLPTSLCVGWLPVAAGRLTTDFAVREVAACGCRQVC